MDVRCSRCQTEYEFDDDKVRGAGVTVKCSTCGHIFKVSPPQDNMPPPTLATAEENVWLVRKADGTVVRFKELTSLQKWIVEQKHKMAAAAAISDTFLLPALAVIVALFLIRLLVLYSSILSFSGEEVVVGRHEKR